MHPYRPLSPPPPPTLTYKFSDSYPLRYSPPPRVRVSQELSPRFRFRDDYDNQFTHNYTEEFSPRVNFDTGHPRHGLGADFHDPISRNYDYTPVYSDTIVKNNIHDAQHNRFVNKDMARDYNPVFRDNLIEIGTHNVQHNRCGNSDLVFSGLARDIYGPSSDFGFRGRKEVFKSPKKVVQKKSALNRIQFSKSQVRNNRIEENHNTSSRSGELDSKTIRNRRSNRVGEESKKNPMELDVSFKSNSLVAKAVEVEGSSNLTPKKRKASNVSSSSSTKASDGGANLKKKSEKPAMMSYMYWPEKGEHFEPTKEHKSVRSIAMTSPQDEADIRLKDKKASASTEEDVDVDIGGSPMNDAEGKSTNSPHLSSPSSAKRTSIEESSLSGDGSDDSHTIRSCGGTSVDAQQASTSADTNNDSRTIIVSPEANLSVGGNVDTDFPRLVETNVQEGRINLCDLSSDVHKSSDSNNERITTTVDSVSKSNNAVVVPEKFAAERFPGVINSDGGNNHVEFTGHGTSTDREEGEIEWNLATPSAIDMFLKEVSLATPVDKTLSCEAKDQISIEEHMVSGINKDGVSPFLGLSINSCDTDYSSRNANSNEISLKSRNVGKDITSVSSSPMLSEEGYSVSAGTFTSSEELTANTDGEDRDLGCKFDILSSNKSSPCSEFTFALLENIGPGASSDDRVLANEDLTENSLQGEKRSLRNITFDGAETIVDQEVLCSMPFPHSEADKDIYQMQLVSDVERDCHLLEKDSLCSPPADQLVCTDGNGSNFTRLSDKNVESESESESDKVSNSGSQETLPVHTESKMINLEKEFGQISCRTECEDSSKQVEKPSAKCSSVTFSLPTLQSTSTGKTGNSVGTVNSLNSIKVGINTTKNLSTKIISSAYQMKSSLKKTIPPSTQFSKPRTWQRSSSSSTTSIPPKPTHPSSVYRRAPSPSVTKNVPTAAYVRKGNSLVRKAPSEAIISKAHALGSSISALGIDETQKVIVKESKFNFKSLQSSSRTESNAAIERPQPLGLPSSSKLSICSNANPSAESGSLVPSMNPLQIASLKTELEPTKNEKNVDSLKHANNNPEFSASCEYLARQIDSSGNEGLDDGKLVSTKNREVVYLKRKANQLIASSSSCDLPAQNADKTEALSSGGYFKRRKNQLVRKSMEIGLKVGMPDENLISESKSALQVASSFRRRTGKGLGKTCRPSRSLVWTPHDAESENKETSLLNHVWPHLFPWKRATYRRRFTNNQASFAKNGSSSWIRYIYVTVLLNFVGYIA